MSIQYRSPLVNEKLDEAFLTSSSRGVVPIISIDDVPVGQGRVGDWTKTLSKAYQAYIQERSEEIVG
jgi:branched-subunit amino acid aminotransferase/4-amino-4-deoxychorismate lyase